MSRKGAELFTETKELINALSESVKNKAELSRMLNIPRTTITSVLSKYRRTLAQWRRSGRKRSFTNRHRNALKRLVTSNRWLTVQDVTAKPNECKTKTFSQKTMQRVLHSEGYKRRLAKNKMVVREANRKKRVKWCKERRGRTVDDYWEKLSNVFRWKSHCARYKQPSLHLAKRRRKVQPTSHLFSLWTKDKFDYLGMYFLWRCWNSGCSWRQHQLFQAHWHPRQELMASSCRVFWRKKNTCSWITMRLFTELTL